MAHTFCVKHVSAGLRRRNYQIGDVDEKKIGI